MKKILITGAKGFLGAYITQLIKNKYDNSLKLFETDKDNLDITDYDGILYNLKQHSPDIVINLAALCGAKASIDNPYDFYRTNTLGVINLLEGMRIVGVKKIIFSSSLTVFGENSENELLGEKRPYKARHPYASSKIASEEIIREYCDKYDLTAIILRPTLVVGPRCKELHAIGDFLKQVKDSGRIEIFGTGSHKRDYIHPEDVASAFISAIDYLDQKLIKKFNDYNLSNGEVLSMNKLADIIINLNQQGFRKHINANYQTFSLFTDNVKAKIDLNWQPLKSVDYIIKELYENFNTTV